MNFQSTTPLTRRRSIEGFTFVEVVVSIALLVMFAGGALWTLTQANSYAALSRLYTGAQVAAQNQVDLIMSKGPFNPQVNQVPTVLGGPKPLPTGGSTTITEDNIPIYSDPSPTNPRSITGQRVTVVTDMNQAASGRTLNMYSATVTVSFTYRGKTHQVQLNAIRAADVDGDS
jgi:type II secretory pathway pseudopilin PulG